MLANAIAADPTRAISVASAAPPAPVLGMFGVECGVAEVGTLGAPVFGTLGAPVPPVLVEGGVIPEGGDPEGGILPDGGIPLGAPEL